MFFQCIVIFWSYNYTTRRSNYFMSSNTSTPIQFESSKKVTHKDFIERPSLDLTILQDDWKNDATLLNKFPKEKRFLTVGIPTVKREKGEYVLNTIQSIVNCTTEKELAEIYIVVFLADFDAKWREGIIQRLRVMFDDIISQGTLHVIQAWKSFYPQLDNLQHTYNDPEIKKKWRAKQNVDYAFLFLYSETLAQYYIQMEDDIYTIPGYLQAIKDYIHSFSERWVCLEFSELGFIGKLYHSYDINKLAKMVLLFYAQQPCDVTYLNFNTQMLQFKRHIRRPTIFEHLGYHSSLPGKVQPLKDRYFLSYPKTLKGDNPPATVYTNMLFEAFFKPDNCYSTNGTIFWSTRPGKANDWITVAFSEPQLINKIEIETRTNTHPNDYIHHAKLEASLSSAVKGSGKPECDSNKVLGYFDNGNVRVNDVQSITEGQRVHCLSIILTKKQETWVIVKEIAVFVDHDQSK